MKHPLTFFLPSVHKYCRGCSGGCFSSLSSQERTSSRNAPLTETIGNTTFVATNTVATLPVVQLVAVGDIMLSRTVGTKSLKVTITHFHSAPLQHSFVWQI